MTPTPEIRVATRHEQPLKKPLRTMRELRVQKRLTLRDLETQSGISRGTLSQIENGLRCPTSRQSRLIAAVLGVDAAKLAVRTFLVVEEPVS